MHKKRSQSQQGQQIVEIAAVLLILVLILVPVISIGVVPLRFELARRGVNAVVHKLAVNDKFSDAVVELQKEQELPSALASIGGVRIRSTVLSMQVTSQKANNLSASVTRPGELAAAWLPDGANAPCDYFLHLKVQTDIDPLITAKVAGQSAAGLNAPITMTIEEMAHWESLGRDPASGKFYLAE
ncbi:MAG TPA: hypothetical protein V6C81_13065 [Planktothrix sp.]